MQVSQNDNKAYYTCCNLTLKTSYQMNGHLSTQKRTQFIGVCNKCTICGVKRSYLSSLKDHLKADHKDVYRNIYGPIPGESVQLKN